MTTIIDFLKSERELYIPIVQQFMLEQKKHYQTLTPEFSELFDYIETYLLRGGKWHRPALGLIAYQLSLGKDLRAARQALVSLEMMHRYILDHDDIIDRDLYRHNGPTIEKIYSDLFTSKYPHKFDAMYSKGNALVAGDVIHSLVYDNLLSSDFSETIRIVAVKNLAKLMLETAAGWQLQMEQNFIDIPNMTEAAFFKGMQLVSAQYSIIWPIRMGQILAGRLTQDSWDKNLEIYGWHTGAAFQIMDDILGIFGDPKETGKPVGHDYREGKKTFLVLYTYEKASSNDRTFMETTIGKEIDEENMHRIQSLMQSTGALERVKAQAAYHAKQAKDALALVKSDDHQSILLLQELADLMSNRTH